MARNTRLGSGIAGAPQRKTTEWHNPTKNRVTVVLHDESNKRFAFVVEPGDTKPLDSSYDRAIQIVDCGREECHNRGAGGHYCNVGHEGSIQGGLAPMLKRVGKDDVLIDELNVPLVEKQQLESRIVAAAQASSLHREVASVVAGRLQEVSSEVAAQEAPAPARPAAAEERRPHSGSAPPASLAATAAAAWRRAGVPPAGAASTQAPLTRAAR